MTYSTNTLNRPAGMNQRRSVGLSQRQSGGLEDSGGPASIESAVIRWRDLPRMARQGGSGNPGTRQLVGGFGRVTAGGGYLPRSAEHEGSRPEDSALAAIPPNSHADLQWAKARMTSGDFLVTGQTDRNKIKTFQKTKTKRGEWAPLTVWSGLLSRCTHEGDTGTCRRGYKLK